MKMSEIFRYFRFFPLFFSNFEILNIFHNYTTYVCNIHDFFQNCWSTPYNLNNRHKSHMTPEHWYDFKIRKNSNTKKGSNLLKKKVFLLIKWCLLYRLGHFWQKWENQNLLSCKCVLILKEWLLPSFRISPL